MQPFRLPATPSAFSLLLIGVLVLSSCGGDGSPSSPPGAGVPPDRDFVALSVGGTAETTHAEASGLPTINCDPRVDWWNYQVLLYENYTNGSGPLGYEFFFGILLPWRDSVGTYTVHGDSLQAFFWNGTRYVAGPLAPSSDGTVVVTRSDDRIEGTFTVTAVDLQQQTTSIALTGRFGVHAGYSTSCQ